jgi:hypothetical protein
LAEVPPVKSNEFLLPISNLRPRTYVVGIAGLGRGGRMGLPAETRVFAPGAIPPAPVALTATRGEAVVDLAWGYPEDIPLVGFRVSLDGRLVADDRELGPGARTWRLVDADPRAAYRFVVQAVVQGGVVSEGTEALTGPATAMDLTGVPAQPGGLTAEWLEATPPRIRLSWTPDPTATSYQMAVDAEEIGTFSVPSEITLPEPGVYVYEAPKEDRSYTFRLQAAGAGGVGPPARVVCLGPGRTLPPAVLAPQARIFESEDGTARVTLRWDYESPAALAGFRVYRDGERMADESSLGRAARAWQSGPLDPGTTYRFELEAMDKDGKPSERGPARPVRVRR